MTPDNPTPHNPTPTQPNTNHPDEELAVMSSTELRDHLLNLNPLNVDWVRKVNAAEAAHWRLREGYRVGYSDQLLGFDCGGQQWVLEVAFPAGTVDKPSHADLKVWYFHADEGGGVDGVGGCGGWWGVCTWMHGCIHEIHQILSYTY